MSSSESPESNDELLSELECADDQRHARSAIDAIGLALEDDDCEPVEDPGLPSDYSVHGILGRGAGGVVYAARQESLGRDVAVKVLFASGGASDTERLLGEARRLARLEHTAIVGIHEVGRAGAGVYLTLDLFRGGSLHDALAQGPLGPMQAAKIVLQVAEGIAFIHARGVVHLDLKPGNVLLDGEGRAAVGDFGLAREVEGLGLTHSSAGLLGTPAFMAPEQAADEREQIGELTDVYGLGALLYAAASGSAPFTAQGLADTLHAVRFDEPRALNLRAPGTPRDLAAIAAKAMSKSPVDRYASASAFAADLARFAAGEPVLARMPGYLHRLGRAVRKHRRETLIAGAGLGLGVLLFFNSDREESKAGEAWLLAALRLVEAGEPNMAAKFLEDAPDWVELTKLQQDRLWTLSRQVSAMASTTGVDSASGSTPPARGASDPLGLDTDSQAWIEQHLSDHGEHLPRRTKGNPLSIELNWFEVLPTLVRTSPPTAGPELLRLLDQLPHWKWERGFEGWLEPAPQDAQELWSRVRAEGVALSEGESCEVAVQLVFFDSEGHVELGKHWRGIARPGERLRFEDRGHSRVNVPRRHFGMDMLRACPPFTPRPRPGDWRFEVEGTLVRTAAGPYWRIYDCEPWMKVPERTGSWFVKEASAGLLAGDAEVIEVRRDTWSGGWVTTLAIAQVARPGEPLAGAALILEDGARELLVGWRGLLDAQLLRVAETIDGRSKHGLEPLPAHRAAMIDTAGSLALLGPNPGPSAVERAMEVARDAEAGALGPLDAGFAAAPTYTSVTSAGANLSTWLSLAATVEGRPLGAALDALPPPGSAYSSAQVETGWRQWIGFGYLLAALLTSIQWLRAVSGSATRLRFAAGAILASSLCLDKVLLHPLRWLSMDVVGCALLAIAAVPLTHWSRRWGRLACACFAAAAIQECLASWGYGFIAPIEGSNTLALPRLPLLLGFLCLIPLKFDLALRPRRHRPWALCALALTVTVVGMEMGLGFWASSKWALLVYLVLIWGIVLAFWRAALLRADDFALSIGAHD